MKRVLVRVVGFLKLIHHEVAVTKRAPDLATRVVDSQDPLKVFCGLFVPKRSVTISRPKMTLGESSRNHLDFNDGGQTYLWKVFTGTVKLCNQVQCADRVVVVTKCRLV